MRQLLDQVKHFRTFGLRFTIHEVWNKRQGFWYPPLILRGRSYFTSQILKVLIREQLVRQELRFLPAIFLQFSNQTEYVKCSFLFLLHYKSKKRQENHILVRAHSPFFTRNFLYTNVLIITKLFHVHYLKKLKI